MKKTLVLMTSILAVATTLTAGLSVLPGSVQNAQAQGIPCDIFPNNIDADEISNNCDFYGNTEIDASNSGRPIVVGGGGGNPCEINTSDIDAEEVENNCDFYGNTKIDASTELPERPGGIPPFPGSITEIPLDEDEEEDEDD